MQDDYRHGNYSGQPQLNSESDDLWRESVENATKLLDPDVYSDGNGCPQLLTHVRTIPSKSHSAEADTSGSQHEPHAVYADQIQPESQIVHYAPCPLHPSATHVDPYAARLSHWMPDPEPTSQGAISLSYFPQQAWPLSPAYSAQNPNTSTMGHPPSPPPPPLTSCWTLHGRNDDNPHPMFGSFLIDGRERQSGVPKACDFCRSRRTRCDDYRPCRECDIRSQECTDDAPRGGDGGPDKTRYAVRPLPGLLQPWKSGYRKDREGDSKYGEYEASTSGHC